MSEYDPTIEAYYYKQVTIDGKQTLIDLLDTAGREEYTVLQDVYTRTGNGALIAYSVTARSSFENIDYFMDRFKSARETMFPVVLIATKSDLEQEREVSLTEGMEKAKLLGCPFFETSAKTRTNIEEPVFELIRMITKTKSKGAKPKKTKCIVM